MLHSFFFTYHLNHKIVNKATCRAPSANPRQLWVHLLKALNCCDYFLRLLGFPNLSGKVHLITFIFSSLEYSTIFRKSNVNKTVWFLYLVSLKYREVITVKLYFFIESLKSKKKKLALTSFYYVSWEIWLGNSKKLICIDQSGFYIFSYPQQFKNV